MEFSTCARLVHASQTGKARADRSEEGRKEEAEPPSVLAPILHADAPPFALLHRPVFGAPDRLDLLLGDVRPVAALEDLAPRTHPQSTPGGPRFNTLALVPFGQLGREKGFACRDDGTPLLAMSVRKQLTVSVQEALIRLPDEEIPLDGARFDIDDDAYAAVVEEVLAREIGGGEGANFVIKRTLTAGLEVPPVLAALSAFKRLLRDEPGAYWTFVVHTGDRTFVGATPERHVTLQDTTVVMNPISGTYRYPAAGPSTEGVLAFLNDRKEADELYMVLDEELKMMARVCEDGGQVKGPYLKEMGRLAHTEFLIEGRSRAGIPQILRETMFAPTVTGSPVESACRVIERYESKGRGYYSGVMALIGDDAEGRPALDSAIVIRTAELDPSGRMEIGVGSTLVRHSSPRAEVAETHAKTAALTAAFTGREAAAAPPPARPGPPLGDQPAVRASLAARAEALAGFWVTAPAGRTAPEGPLTGRTGLLVDGEDTFTDMLRHHLAAIGAGVTIQSHRDPFDPRGYDFVVVGPGPGDPRAADHPKIRTLREVTGELLRTGRPFLSLCLGHQVLCGLLGLELRPRKRPSQGRQSRVHVFGQPRTVGFYNTFAAFSDTDHVPGRHGDDAVAVSRDPVTGEVNALAGATFRSFQFHPESILSRDGSALLAQALTTVLPAPRGVPHPSPHTAVRGDVAAATPR
ncbi:chorismate-binding protein [Streptomyces katrae]|uniref:anthranilate synthase n=1 Tax=Streptomyces katrae TaxID=68223 RepID=A0ABT7GT58_9ACTN|nr:chorismate-binding protein [Streptomyces katrae]MDK9496099.1 chorismate-binding protein [Streptomyces katrae]